MPYIAQKDRPQLDQHIDALAEEIKKIAASYGYDGAFAGLVNYAFTTTLLKVMPARRYWVVALVTGVLVNVKDEFYRRYAAPYEDKLIKTNGDCY